MAEKTDFPDFTILLPFIPVSILYTIIIILYKILTEIK